MALRDLLRRSKREQLYKKAKRGGPRRGGLLYKTRSRQVQKGPWLSRIYKQCGKEGCKCNRGEKHGPYFHASWVDGNGRQRIMYLGKDLPAQWLSQVRKHAKRS